MNLGNYVNNLGISVYSLSKKSSVPYTTLSSICNGSADVKECRVNTLIKISEALKVNLLDLINNNLSLPVKYNFIDGNVNLNVSDLPKAMKNTIKELEEYDRNNDPMFYECADMLYMMADRFLKDGAIDSATHEKIIMKYPIA
jgi:DNA-binding Xre family transcriptional regulator